MDQLKKNYVGQKLRAASYSAAWINYLLASFIFAIADAFVFSHPDYTKNIPFEHQGYDAATYQDIMETTQDFHNFIIIWAVMLAINVLLILSPLRGTLGMRALGVQVKRQDNKPPTIPQAVGIIFLSPFTLSQNLYFLFILSQGHDPNVYTGGNAMIVLIFGTYALQYAVYAFKFGNILSALQSLTGLETIFRPQKQAKLEKKFDKKGARSLKFTEKWLKTRKTLSEVSATFLIILALYMSSLVIADLFKKPVFEERLYAPYALNWGQNNGFFALEGLTAPANETDFYAVGRATTYQFFVKNEQLKKIGNIPYAFDIPPKEGFVPVDTDYQPLEFKSLWPEKDKKDFSCLYLMDFDLKPDTCASFKDVESTIGSNKILWERFNKLPSYTEFQRPPIGISGKMKGQSFIELARVKAAQIILMQQKGQSKEALEEWARFMQFYRRATEAKTGLLEKAIYMIVFGFHQKTLEKLVYNDPQLAVDYFDLITTTLNPQGVTMFHGQTMITDDLAGLDPFMPSFRAGPAPGVRNKYYNCFLMMDKLTELPPKQFFFGATNHNPCPDINGNPSRTMFEMWFMTTGNPITNTIYGLLYPGLLKGQELIGNMHVTDTHMRMTLLGAKILHDKIPLDHIADFVQHAPVELQNPITESPFDWDAKGKYLYFIQPSTPDYQIKFRLNINKMS